MRRATPALLLLYAVVASANTQPDIPRMTVFPQVVAGGPWSSDFFITNQGLTTIPGIELALFNDAGAPMVVTTPTLGAASLFKFNLQPGETASIRATRAPDATDVQGFAELFCPPRASVRAALIVRYAPDGRPAGQIGMSEQFPFSHFSFPGEVGPQANTGMAIAVPTYGYGDIPDQRVLVSVLDLSGTLVQTKEVVLPAGKHAAFFLGEIFPTLGNFRGRVLVSGPDWLGVTALRSEGETLGSVCVDEGVELAPFFVNANPFPETEPNDDPTSAQALTAPAVISGVIGATADADSYRFTGRRGDIVSMLVETASLETPSDLDSEVTILTADRSEIAWNDQNGTVGKFRHDAFVRMALPADGTYFVRITDANGNGGNSFGYKLHAKVQTP